MDRKDLAGITRALSALDPEAVAYDIIFARESSPAADLEFIHSLGQLTSVFLPAGFKYSSIKKPFKWESGSAYQRLKNEYLKNPGEKGSSRPYYATRALVQADDVFPTATDPNNPPGNQPPGANPGQPPANPGGPR